MFILLKHYNGHTAAKIHGQRATLGPSVADLICLITNVNNARVPPAQICCQSIAEFVELCIKTSQIYGTRGYPLHGPRAIPSQTRPAASYYRHQLSHHNNIVMKRARNSNRKWYLSELKLISWLHAIKYILLKRVPLQWESNDLQHCYFNIKFTYLT